MPIASSSVTTRAERIDCAAALASESALRRLADRVKANAVFVYPTDTIYGVGGRADSDAVRERILEAKGRSPGNPLIVVAACRTAFDSLGVSFPPAAERLSSACWPGRLTLVLPTAHGGDLAVRLSAHPFLKALGRHETPALFSTSANASGCPYDPDPDRIYALGARSVDVLSDEGRRPASAPSSIVRGAASGDIRLLREGAVGRHELETVLGHALG